tara:strand:- start:1328 stop:1639 length:312 start_codon:yes stop_codon:yes gene_type:complete
MAVETDTERAIFFNTNDFGDAASYTPQGGSAITINGIFDDEDFEVEVGGEVAVAMEQPRFTCRTSDVSSAAEGDTININSQNYTIRVVENGGTGVTVLVLEEA